MDSLCGGGMDFDLWESKTLLMFPRFTRSRPANEAPLGKENLIFEVARKTAVIVHEFDAIYDYPAEDDPAAQLQGQPQWP